MTQDLNSSPEMGESFTTQAGEPASVNNPLFNDVERRLDAIFLCLCKHENEIRVSWAMLNESAQGQSSSTIGGYQGDRVVYPVQLGDNVYKIELSAASTDSPVALSIDLIRANGADLPQSDTKTIETYDNAEDILSKLEALVVENNPESENAIKAIFSAFDKPGVTVLTGPPVENRRPGWMG